MTSERAGDWQRVTRQNPCPICGKPDWCAVSSNGEVARCMRVCRGAFETTRDGGSHHRLRERASECVSRPSTERASVARASIEFRDRAYRSLLTGLRLDPRHALDLLARGLGDTTIAENLYATVGEDVDSFVSELAATIGEALAAGPGFVYRNGRWHLGAPPGELLIPCRDERGMIEGIVRRTGDPSKKYAWLSSAPFGGPGPGGPLPLHFAATHRVEINHTPLIVEGVLKADVTADLSGFAVVGLPSISAAGNDTVEALLRALPAAHRWGIALDQDKRTNEAVRDAEARLIAAFRVAGQPSFVLDWKRGKGPDDFLAEVQCA